MNLDRRWWIAIGVVVVVLVGLVVSRTFLRSPPEECGPVQELLDFNRSQSAAIESKFADSQGIPDASEEAAYQAWADGLADRAQNVSSPELARTAGQVASLADEFVSEMATVRAQADARAPGAPAPPAVYELAGLNEMITRKLAELSDACSG